MANTKFLWSLTFRGSFSYVYLRQRNFGGSEQIAVWAGRLEALACRYYFFAQWNGSARFVPFISIFKHPVKTLTLALGDVQTGPSFIGPKRSPFRIMFTNKKKTEQKGSGQNKKMNFEQLPVIKKVGKALYSFEHKR